MTITGKKMKAIRERLRESQAAFAKRFGVNQSTIHRWEESGPPESGPIALLISRVFDDLQRREAA